MILFVFTNFKDINHWKIHRQVLRVHSRSEHTFMSKLFICSAGELSMHLLYEEEKNFLNAKKNFRITILIKLTKTKQEIN